jgi:hypothetical protein
VLPKSILISSLINWSIRRIKAVLPQVHGY